MTPKVLLVEDNADDEALIRRAFEHARAGDALEVARDGNSAIERTLGLPRVERPALILLDLRLPGLSGFEVLESLRRDEATMLTPVVVISASRDASDIARSYALGANSYLVKPTEFEALQRMVEEVLGYWLRHNEAPPLLPD